MKVIKHSDNFYTVGDNYVWWYPDMKRASCSCNGIKLYLTDFGPLKTMMVSCPHLKAVMDLEREAEDKGSGEVTADMKRSG